MKRGYLDTPEGHVHYVEDGTGDALLLLHQSPRSVGMFRKLMPLLASEFRVIAVDMLGYGQSAAPTVTDDLVDTTDLARNVAHALDALQIDRSYLFGFHTGAFIAAETAADNPQRFHAIALGGFPFVAGESDTATYRETASYKFFDPGSSADGSHFMRIWMRAYSDVLRFWMANDGSPADETAPDILRSPSPHRALHNFLTADELEFLDHWVVDCIHAPYVKKLYGTMWTKKSEVMLSRIHVPVLFIEPDSPFETPFCRRAEEASAYVANSSVTTIPNSDDNMVEFRTPAVADVLKRFFLEHPMAPLSEQALRTPA
jgi:pimeloyl-ACP methyl ester carboxylesterase